MTVWGRDMNRMINWLQKEPVLTISWILAFCSMLLVPPDRQYAGYLDLHTLCLLFCLMAVMAGFQRIGFFHRLGQTMLSRTHSIRQLEGVLILSCFFSSMLITNDVALITFVPFAIEVLHMAGQDQRLVPVVVMQTIAANLGSMATPIGNPQNLYLYARYNFSASVFIQAMLPYTIVSLACMLLFLSFQKRTALSIQIQSKDICAGGRWRVMLYSSLFVLCIGAVVRIIPIPILVCIVTAACFAADRGIFKQVDYSLLLTFAGFFILIGNLGRIEPLIAFFQAAVNGHEIICAILASQIISNVPAALLLSGFTEQGSRLLIGVNLGGLGTLIASMASLISYKYVSLAVPKKRGVYLRVFTIFNVLFLLPLLALAFWGRF